jgi:PAS domain S-box-containing protein
VSVSVQRVTNPRSPTDQPRLQQTLLGEAVEGAPFAVFVFDEDRNHVAVNEAACELTGYTRQELLDLDALALSGRRRRRADRVFQEVAAGTRSSGHGAIRRKDGTLVDVTYQVAETSVAGAQFFISICHAA